MFDSVSRKDFDTERELRIKAEATADALREQVQLLKDLLRQQGEQQTDILDRLQPKPEKMPMFNANLAPRLTAEQIMRMPAAGKRDIRARNALIKDAEAREKQAESAEKIQERREGLSEEEAVELDAAISGSGVGV